MLLARYCNFIFIIKVLRVNKIQAETKVFNVITLTCHRFYVSHAKKVIAAGFDNSLLRFRFVCFSDFDVHRL